MRCLPWSDLKRITRFPIELQVGLRLSRYVALVCVYVYALCVCVLMYVRMGSCMIDCTCYDHLICLVLKCVLFSFFHGHQSDVDGPLALPSSAEEEAQARERIEAAKAKRREEDRIAKEV